MIMDIVRRLAQVTGLGCKIDIKLGRTITRTIGCKIDTPNGSDFISCRFTFTRNDPYAVRLAFLDDGNVTQEWIIARDLAKAGLEVTAGEGDVIICPGYDTDGHEVVIMTLTVKDQWAMFTFMRHRYEEIINLIWTCVPDGHEARYQTVPNVDRFMS